MTEPVAPNETEQRRIKPLIIVAVAIVAVIVLFLAARLLAAAVAGGPTLNVEAGLPVTVEVSAGSSAKDIANAIAENHPDQLGDISTLAEPAVVNHLLEEKDRMGAGK